MSEGVIIILQDSRGNLWSTAVRSFLFFKAGCRIPHVPVSKHVHVARTGCCAFTEVKNKTATLDAQTLPRLWSKHHWDQAIKVCFFPIALAQCLRYYFLWDWWWNKNRGWVQCVSIKDAVYMISLRWIYIRRQIFRWNTLTWPLLLPSLKTTQTVQRVLRRFAPPDSWNFNDRSACVFDFLQHDIMKGKMHRGTSYRFLVCEIECCQIVKKKTSACLIGVIQLLHTEQVHPEQNNHDPPRTEGFIWKSAMRDCENRAAGRLYRIKAWKYKVMEERRLQLWDIWECLTHQRIMKA